MLEKTDFPFDANLILRKKNKIKKELLKNKKLKNLNFAILGGSTTNEIKNILEIYLLKYGFKPKFYESDYNKYYEDSVFENKLLKKFKPQIIYIHTSNVNIENYPKIDDDIEKVNLLIKKETKKFKNIWTSLSQYNCSIIQNNFELPYNRVLGNLDFSDFRGKTNFINRLNLKFSEIISDNPSIYVNDINYISSKIGLENWFDKSLWYRSKYALSFSSIPSLCINIAGIVNGIFGKTKKCLVLDLDNTLWGGIIGDDDISGIKLGKETAEGEAYLDFQKYVKKLKQRGIVLAVSSKNNHDIAKSGFTHSDSVLSFDDFSVFKANWDPKNLNILKIADELNLGIDSFVFIDDNPAERNLVSSQIPSISVPNIGDNVLEYIDHIEENKFFEISSLSSEDLARSKLYSDNKKRYEESSQFKNYKDFLKSMEMKAEINQFNNIYIERTTQLINKTNQFNLTTKRYTLKEIKSIKDDKNYIKLYARLKDRFGDNGLVSVIIGKIENNSCIIESWLMSCRVLKRDLEFELMNKFIDLCKTNNIDYVKGNYFQTKKNLMVSKLYGELGFKLIDSNKDGDSFWEIKLSDFKKINTSISIVEEYE